MKQDHSSNGFQLKLLPYFCISLSIFMISRMEKSLQKTTYMQMLWMGKYAEKMLLIFIKLFFTAY